MGGAGPMNLDVAARRSAAAEAVRLRQVGHARAYRIREAIRKSPGPGGIGLLRPRHAGEVARRAAVVAMAKAEKVEAGKGPDLTETELDVLFGIGG